MTLVLMKPSRFSSAHRSIRNPDDAADLEYSRFLIFQLFFKGIITFQRLIL
jgi:hypothetical protein